MGKWQYHGGFSILVELEDFYAVDIHEINDGERKSENMDQNLKETLGKVTEYAGMKQEEKQKKMNRNFLLGGLCLFTVICDRQFHVLSFIFRDPIANFVNGALFAMGVLFELIGFYNNNHEITLEEKKRRIFGKRDPERTDNSGSD